MGTKNTKVYREVEYTENYAGHEVGYTCKYDTLMAHALVSRKVAKYTDADIAAAHERNKAKEEVVADVEFNAEGFDAEGFNAEGFNAEGFDAEGFNAEGFNAEGFDAEGYDRDGFNTKGKERKKK